MHNVASRVLMTGVQSAILPARFRSASEPDSARVRRNEEEAASELPRATHSRGDMRRPDLCHKPLEIAYTLECIAGLTACVRIAEEVFHHIVAA